MSRGVRQFLDLGSGIPAEGAVHEVARAVDPAARVAYVDRDSTAVLHARAATRDDSGTVVLQQDLEQAAEILADPGVRELVDFTAPICVVIISVLHFVPDSESLTAALRRYHEVAVPGSLLAVTHANGDARPAGLDRVADLYSRTGAALVLRDKDQLMAMFADWDMVEPGLVPCTRWQPDPGTPQGPDPADDLILGGVGVKREPE